MSNISDVKIVERCEFGNEQFCESPESVEAQIPKDVGMNELPNTGTDPLMLAGIGIVCIVVGMNLCRRVTAWLKVVE